MPHTGKRFFIGRSKGYLHASGSQFRFIMFLVILLVCFTLLLRVFQKLAEIVQLPVFLPIALITLLVFIGIVGILYSHTFLGPMIRIRRELEHMAEGETNITLRLRESDDPMLLDVVETINQLCERRRESRGLIRDAASELSRELGLLQDSVRGGAAAAEIGQRLDAVRAKHEVLEKAIKAGIKS